VPAGKTVLTPFSTVIRATLDRHSRCQQQHDRSLLYGLRSSGQDSDRGQRNWRGRTNRSCSGAVITYAVTYTNVSSSNGDANCVKLTASNLVITEDGLAAPNNWGTYTTNSGSPSDSGAGVVATVNATTYTTQLHRLPGALRHLHISSVRSTKPKNRPQVCAIRKRRGGFRFQAERKPARRFKALNPVQKSFSSACTDAVDSNPIEANYSLRLSSQCYLRRWRARGRVCSTMRKREQLSAIAPKRLTRGQRSNLQYRVRDDLDYRAGRGYAHGCAKETSPSANVGPHEQITRLFRHLQYRQHRELLHDRQCGPHFAPQH